MPARVLPSNTPRSPRSPSSSRTSSTTSRWNRSAGDACQSNLSAYATWPRRTTASDRDLGRGRQRQRQSHRDDLRPDGRPGQYGEAIDHYSCARSRACTDSRAPRFGDRDKHHRHLDLADTDGDGGRIDKQLPERLNPGKRTPTATPWETPATTAQTSQCGSAGHRRRRRQGRVDDCPSVSNADQADGDADGTGDACDGCPSDPEKTVPVRAVAASRTRTATRQIQRRIPADPAKTAQAPAATRRLDSDGRHAELHRQLPGGSEPFRREPAGAASTAHTDSDGDGTVNCTDACPFDRTRSRPGCAAAASPTRRGRDGTDDCR
jgi:hypothetical protein